MKQRSGVFWHREVNEPIRVGTYEGAKEKNVAYFHNQFDAAVAYFNQMQTKLREQRNHG